MSATSHPTPTVEPVAFFQPVTATPPEIRTIDALALSSASVMSAM
jgi:hypothetical protein